MSKSRAGTDKLKKTMLAALEQHLGIVTAAAKKAGISRGSHYLWMREDPDYRAAVEELDEVAMDFAESALFKQIEEGVPTSTQFYLKYRARKRGYVDRRELTGADGVPLVTTLDPTKLSTEAIREILAATENNGPEH